MKEEDSHLQEVAALAQAVAPPCGTSKFSDFRYKSLKKAPWIRSWKAYGGESGPLQQEADPLKVETSSKNTGGGKSLSGIRSRSSRRNEYFWTMLVSRYTKRGQGRQALGMLEKMREDGVEPSKYTYVALLQACSSLQDLESARRIHAEVVRSGHESDLYVGTMLVDAYAKCRSLVDARIAFENMPRHDVVSWNAMILGYAQTDRSEVALDLYERMQEDGVVPDDRTYVSVLRACSSLAELEERNDEDSLRRRCLEIVKAIHADIQKQKFESDMFVATMLVDVYAKCGNLDDARQVFEKMPQRDVISWNAMILGYAQMDAGEVALHLYSRMQQDGVTPNERTYLGAITACGSLAGLDKGKSIHAQILKAGPQAVDSFVAHALITMYGKCGSMVDAQQVFDSMPTRGIVAWNALIAGYAHQGESELVFNLFQRMKQDGVRPDSITLLSVLTACNHGGLVDGGHKYFESMTRDYGVSPTLKHWTCMVDLLGRAGYTEKAMKMVKAMPFLPDSAVWECMLGACRKWCDVELGREAFECALGLDTNYAAAYVLMSSIYTSADMLEQADKVQVMRVKSGAWKQPGQSKWTDMCGIAHVFVVGDRGHPENTNIYAELGKLWTRMAETLN